MNSQDNKNIEPRGIILTDNVDLEWLDGLEPKFNGNRIKWDVNINTNKVCVGMNTHASTFPEFGENSDLLGGFIHSKNGRIEYDSTLNIKLNERLGTHGDTMREIVDEDWIARINNILLAWVVL